MDNLANQRWRTGEGSNENSCMLFRDNHCVGMVSSPDLAKEICERLNDVAPNDREFIVRALRMEANRIFNKQERDFPSNTLDAVAANLTEGKSDNLSVKPEWFLK
jgi:hypothetical protein